MNLIEAPKQQLITEIDAASKSALPQTHEQKEKLDFVKNVQGARAQGDATDIYGFFSPLNNTKKHNDSNSDNNNSVRSDHSDDRHSIKVFREDDLMGECHVSFDKLLSSLFKFRASKNSNMTRSMVVSEAEQDPVQFRRQKTMMDQKQILKF